MKGLFVLAACIALGLAVNDAEFLQWMSTHNKQYSTPEEARYRYVVWKKNKDFVVEHNAKNLGFTVELNKFADLPVEEFRSTYNGHVMKPRDSSRVKILSEVKLPSSVDWRTKGIVTPIKNQGQCGSCWSFSTTGSVEGQHALKTGNLVGLSESNLVDCSSGFGNDGCNGGTMDDAFQYIMSCGIDTESSYPYVPDTETCQYNANNVAAHITGYQDIPSGSESQLQTAVANVGPVSVAIDASHQSFQLYSGGVYYEADCSSSSLDHGVLAVGYGVSSGKAYWLVKNSWGTDWGIEGYIMMSRNRNNNCGIATMASYPTGASILERNGTRAASCSQSSSSSSTSGSSSGSSSSTSSGSSSGMVF